MIFLLKLLHAWLDRECARMEMADFEREVKSLTDGYKS